MSAYLLLFLGDLCLEDPELSRLLLSRSPRSRSLSRSWDLLFFSGVLHLKEILVSTKSLLAFHILPGFKLSIIATPSPSPKEDKQKFKVRNIPYFFLYNIVRWWEKIQIDWKISYILPTCCFFKKVQKLLWSKYFHKLFKASFITLVEMHEMKF